MWWRIDDEHPDDWSWEAFAVPRHRFDPPSGRFRMRYAVNDPVAAARERFPSRRLADAHGGLHLVRLESPPSSLPLTHQRTLDVLGLDDRINTGRVGVVSDGGPLLASSQTLSDRVWDWWDGAPPPITYRTRASPSARSIAFGEHVAWTRVTGRTLREARALLVSLVVHHGFDVPDSWLAGS